MLQPEAASNRFDNHQCPAPEAGLGVSGARIYMISRASQINLTNRRYAIRRLLSYCHPRTCFPSKDAPTRRKSPPWFSLSDLSNRFDSGDILSGVFSYACAHDVGYSFQRRNQLKAWLTQATPSNRFDKTGTRFESLNRFDRDQWRVRPTSMVSANDAVVPLMGRFLGAQSGHACQIDLTGRPTNQGGRVMT